MLRDRISEVMTHKVVSASESSSVYEAACLMSERNIGSVMITEDGRIKGILTERDVLRQLGSGDNLEHIQVSDLMTEDVVTADPATTIAEASDILIKHRFRRLPIVEDEILVGIVTATDLTFEMESPNASDMISEYMSSTVYTVQSNASIAEAVNVMVEKNIGSVIVVDEKKITGILTERDILCNVVAKKRNTSETRVSQVMSSEIVTLEPDTQISHTCHLMYYYGFRRFPVVDEADNLIGVISERDVLTALRKTYLKGR
jgi:CBS domain-containing protein